MALRSPVLLAARRAACCTSSCRCKLQSRERAARRRSAARASRTRWACRWPSRTSPGTRHPGRARAGRGRVHRGDAGTQRRVAACSTSTTSTSTRKITASTRCAFLAAAAARARGRDPRRRPHPSPSRADHRHARRRRRAIRCSSCSAGVLERTGPMPVLLERDNDDPASWRSSWPRSARSTRVYRRSARAREERRASRRLRARCRARRSARSSMLDGAQRCDELARAPRRGGSRRARSSSSGLERLSSTATLVRDNLREAVELAMPRSDGAARRRCSTSTSTRFLAERGPRTHYLRDVTTEFLALGRAGWPSDARAP